MKSIFTAIRFSVYAAIAIFALISVYLFVTHTDPVSGKVTKLWTEQRGLHGQDDYALVVSPNGTATAILLFPVQYGILEVGVSCSFNVDHWHVAQSMICNPVGDK